MKRRLQPVLACSMLFSSNNVLNFDGNTITLYIKGIQSGKETSKSVSTSRAADISLSFAGDREVRRIYRKLCL